jgi:O-antigen/teichoic acid export membrane protein
MSIKMDNDERKRNKYFVLNIFWSFSVIFINCIVQFLITPYITNRIGIDAYGFVSLANNIMGYIDILAVAVNAYSARYIAIEFHNNNIEKANNYFSSVLFANVILSIAIAVPSSVLVFNLEKIININDALVSDVKFMFILVFINYVITVIGSLYNVAAFIKGRLDLTSMQKNTAAIIKVIILLLLCILFEPKVWYVVIATIACYVYTLLINVHYKNKLTPQLKFKSKYLSWGAIKTLLSAGVWNSINNLGNTLNNGLDLLISNLLLSSTSMGQVAVGKNLASLLGTCMASLSNTYQPEQLRLYAEGDTEGLIDNLKQSIRISGCFGNIIVVCVIVCGMPLLRCWLGERQDLEVIYQLTIMIFLAEVIAYTVRPLNFAFVLTTKLKFGCFITVMEGLANVLMMVFFIKGLGIGVYAIVLSTLILHNAVMLIATPLYANSVLKIEYKTFYGEVFKSVFVFGISLVISLITINFMTVENRWLSLILSGIVGLIISIVCEILFGLKKAERRLISTLLKSKVLRK